MKTVVLSTNDDENYLNYLPYIQKAWNKLGWNTITFYLGEKEIDSDAKNRIVKIKKIEGIREATIVQVYRLLAHNFTDGLIMTSDVDMMPLSNYWNPEIDKFTCYGKDLTHNVHYPICYIAAPDYLWKKLIPETSIEELLNKYPQHKSENFNKWWFTDQDIVTQRLSNFDLKSIERGFENGLASGRIDRCEWFFTKYISKTDKIDAHMPRPFDKNEAEDLLNNVLSI